MLINRTLMPILEKRLNQEPAIVLLYGPRQAGKTTLIRELVKGKEGVVLLTGDDIRVQELFAIPRLDRLRAGVGDARILVIDEAQRIENIGLSLKLLFDEKPFPIIASGSSSLDLAHKVNEPLTGRATVYRLYPLSLLEIPPLVPHTPVESRLEEFLRFGMYPKVMTTVGDEEKKKYLNDLVNLYLYKDILSFEQVRKPKKVVDLLSLLALQIGSEVRIQELAEHLSLSKVIVEKYLNLLEHMFVIVNVRGFSRNLRKEISKTSKYYFVDVGLRNALIQNFNPLHLRNDAGALFENFCIIERMKASEYRQQFAQFYFWRTYDQKEIDLIEEREGNLYTYEFKFSSKESPPGAGVKEFLHTYPQSAHAQVHPANVEEFLNR